MALTEDRRKQLDGIIQQMELNGEPEEAIRFVVEDFKGKYGANEQQGQKTIADNLGKLPIVGGLITGLTQAIAAPGIQKTLNEANATQDFVNQATIRKLKEAQAAGDTTAVQRLTEILKGSGQQPQTTTEDITGRFRTNKEVIGSAAQTALMFAPGVAGSTRLGTKVLTNAATGAASGAAGAMEQNGNAGNAAIGALLGGALGGVIPLAGAGIQKAKQFAGRTGEAIALKGLRPSPTQIKNFSKKTGEDLADFVIKNKLFERGDDQVVRVQSLVDDVQAQFDAIAKGSGRKIPMAELRRGFDAKIKELGKSIDPADLSKAKQLQQFRDQLLNNIEQADGLVDVGAVSAAKTQYGKAISPSDFIADPVNASARREAYKVTRQGVEKATKDLTGPNGESLNELGRKLRSLYEFKDLAENRANLGKGNLPFGLLQAGSAGSGALFGAFQGDSDTPADKRVLNAAMYGLGALGLGAVANNPKVVGAVSRGLIGLSKDSKLPKSLSPVEKLLTVLVGGTIGRSTKD